MPLPVPRLLRVATPDLAGGQKCMSTATSTAHLGDGNITNTAAEPKDVYTCVTERIISDVVQRARPWMKPWNAEHAAGRITRPLRHNGTPCRVMNVLLLWGEPMDKEFAAPIWMTYNQAQELGANVSKGENGSLVVYANNISKTETNEQGRTSGARFHS